MVCEFGQRVTNAFESIEYTLQTLDWYSFPLAMQQNLLIIWAFTQKPIAFTCFGSISCNRKCFKQVNLKIIHSLITLKKLQLLIALSIGGEQSIFLLYGALQRKLIIQLAGKCKHFDYMKQARSPLTT